MKMRLKNISRFMVLKFLSFLMIVYICFKRTVQTKTYSIFLPNQRPKVVWNHVADFSNIAKLNPKIHEWHPVGGEVSDGNTWKYKIVSYEATTGNYLDFVLGLNENHGDITIETQVPDKVYTIKEDYQTLSLRGLLTIHNWTRMDFSLSIQDTNIGTLFHQNVYMDCPLLFSWFCISMTDHNRQVFMKNLAQKFTK